MPRIAIYGVPVETVKKFSKALIDDLVELSQTPRDHFSIQVNRDVFVHDGREVSSDPFVEICLFERAEEVEDAFAKAITKHLCEQGFACVDVYITHLARRRYFENGNHF